MRLIAIICAVFCLAVPATAAEKSLSCATGPVSKTFGKTPWLVFSCDDNRTVVIFAAPGSPAAPAYFIFAPHDDGYRLGVEGSGRKDATDAAVAELKALSPADVLGLIQQTKHK